MSASRFYQVLGDLTEDQYQTLQKQAEGNPYRFPPLLHMVTRSGTHFTEDNIPAIVADAVHASTKMSLQTKLAAEENHNEFQMTGWPLDMKHEIMKDARDSWFPGDNLTASHWPNTAQADAFLDKHPELTDMFQCAPDTTHSKWLQRKQAEEAQPA